MTPNTDDPQGYKSRVVSEFTTKCSLTKLTQHVVQTRNRSATLA